MTTGILQLSKKFLHDRIIPFNLKIAGKNLKHMKSNSNTYAVEIGLQFANYYVSPSSLSNKKKKKINENTQTNFTQMMARSLYLQEIYNLKTKHH